LGLPDFTYYMSIKKEILFVNPAVVSNILKILYLYFKRFVPSVFFILSALSPEDYKIKIVNQKIFWFKKDFLKYKGCLVGITCTTISVINAYRLADRFKQAGAYVVMGGPHVSVLPDEALKHCHSVVIGEAEGIWKELLQDYEKKQLKNKYEASLLDDFFSPVYEYFLKLKPKILRIIGIFTHRGCKYNCEFCVTPKKKLRFIKIEQIVGLIERMKQERFFSFIQRPSIALMGDNIYSNPDFAKRLFKSIIPLGISWVANASIDIAFDEEALSLARQSGCRLLFIGFETIFPSQLSKLSLPTIKSHSDYIKAVKNIKAHKIRVTGAFIVGFDSYKHKDYFRLIFLMARMRLFFVSLTTLTPFPGSALFKRLKKENRILTYDWKKYSVFSKPVFKPNNMSVISVKIWFIFIRIVSLLLSTLTSILILMLIWNIVISVLDSKLNHQIATERLGSVFIVK